MKINKQTKIDALMAATIKLFGTRMADLDKRCCALYENYLLNKPENIESMKWFVAIPYEYKSKMYLMGSTYATYVGAKEDKTSHFDFKTKSYIKFPISDKAEIKPFCQNYQDNQVSFSKSLFLANSDCPTVEESAPFVALNQERAQLNEEIVAFMNDAYYALLAIGTAKQLQEDLPAFVQYFPQVVPQNRLICTELNKKVTALLELA